MSIRSRHSRRKVPITRSQMALARGARTGLLMILMPSAAKTASKEAVNLVSRSRMRNLTAHRLVGEVHREVAGLLGHPVGDRLGGHAGDPDKARVVVDEHEDVEPAEEHRVDMEEVARHQSLRLCGKELRPGRSRSPRRRLDTVALQDRPDARGGDGDAHGGELAVDPAVAPSRVLLRQPEDERGGSLRDAGRPGRPCG